EGPNNDDFDPGAFCGTDCVPRNCGDGVLDDGEQCDHGAMNDDTIADACRTHCLLAYCGDGAVDLAEECDDGDLNRDSEPDACRVSCRAPYCGDRIRDSGESCDGTYCCAFNCSCDTTVAGCFAFEGGCIYLGGPG